LRIHVERAIGRVKEYHILQGVLPAAIWDTINQIVYACCMLSNFNPPLMTYARKFPSDTPPVPKMRGGIFIPLTAWELCEQCIGGTL